MNTAKKKAWTACSKYIRLRDALDYCDRYSIDLSQFNYPKDIVGQCCTCNAVKSWIGMDAGHWIGRGTGGHSGTYFDERNIHLQCKRCNAWGADQQRKHEIYILRRYKREIIDELERKHRIPLDSRSLPMKAMEIFYTEKYNELVQDHGL